MSINKPIAEITADDVWGLVGSDQNENLRLEYKRANRADMSPEDRKNFAKVLSALSNADGGRIVWGVECVNAADGSDTPSAIIPIQPLSSFLEAIERVTADAASPIVDAVVHRAIDLGDNSGVVITDVPRSDSGPHMAKCRENRYYKRSGSQSIMMEHFDIEDMMGRRQRPVLALEARVINVGRFARTIPNEEQWNGTIVLSINNTGRAGAPAPYLSIAVPSGFSIAQYGLDGNTGHTLPKLPSSPRMAIRGSTWEHFGGTTTHVIPPGYNLDICALVTRIADPEQATPPDLRIVYDVAAENFALKTDRLAVTGGELEVMRNSNEILTTTGRMLRD